VKLNGAGQTGETTKLAQRDSWKITDLNSQATEQASFIDLNSLPCAHFKYLISGILGRISPSILLMWCHWMFLYISHALIERGLIKSDLHPA
jgi:hypothetical protein